VQEESDVDWSHKQGEVSVLVRDRQVPDVVAHKWDVLP
jgi:hypothetical protein